MFGFFSSLVLSSEDQILQILAWHTVPYPDPSIFHRLPGYKCEQNIYEPDEQIPWNMWWQLPSPKVR